MLYNALIMLIVSSSLFAAFGASAGLAIALRART
jgi:hypothetical protein